MRDLFNTLRFIIRHPLNRGKPFSALWRFVRWQIVSRLSPGLIAVPFAGRTSLLARQGMLGATGNVYCGLHEFEDMALVLHTLGPGDLFVDVGANVGSYTVLAGGVCGASVIAAEPVPATFESLADNIRINRIEARVDARNIAVGAQAGQASFTASLDTVNHVVSKDEAGSGNTITVPVETLDGLLEGRSPAMVKIDVEGYETEVINGAEKSLADTRLLALLLELNGSGQRYGYDEEKLHQRLLGQGFIPCRYSPFERKIIPLGGKNPSAGNTLYVRDIEALRQRIAKARPFTVLGHEI